MFALFKIGSGYEAILIAVSESIPALKYEADKEQYNEWDYDADEDETINGDGFFIRPIKVVTVPKTVQVFNGWYCPVCEHENRRYHDDDEISVKCIYCESEFNRE